MLPMASLLLPLQTGNQAAKPGCMEHTPNPSIWEPEVGVREFKDSRSIKYQASLGYLKPYRTHRQQRDWRIGSAVQSPC